MSSNLDALLEVPRVKDTHTKALEEAGFTTLQKIAVANIEDLNAEDIPSLKGLGEKSLLAIIAVAQEKTGIGIPTNALTALRAAAKNRYIHSGSLNVDQVLGGGFPCGYTTEIYGKEGSGKTQGSCQVIINAVLPLELGGIGGRALLIDTENRGGKMVARLNQMVIARGGDAEKVLPRIDFLGAQNSTMQMAIIKRILDKGERYDAVVIDGLMSRFRGEYIGRENLAERQGIIREHLDDLGLYATQMDAAVVYTNQVMDRPDASGPYVDPTTPIGGHIVGHSSLIRLYVKRGAQGKRILRVVKSLHLQEAEAVFKITDKGIEDA